MTSAAAATGRPLLSHSEKLKLNPLTVNTLSTSLTVNGKGRLRNICSNNAFPAAGGCRIKDHSLNFRRKGGINWQNDKGRGISGFQSLHAFMEGLTRGVNFLLASKKQQYVPRGLAKVNLEDSNQCRFHVVRLWFLCV